MAPEKVGNQALPTDAQITGKEFVVGLGESAEYEWSGTPGECEVKYDLLKANAIAGNGIEQVRWHNRTGRGTVMYRQARYSGSAEDPYAEIEEVYAVDVMRDTESADYFTAGTYELSDDECVWVKLCAEQSYDEDEITAYAIDADGAAVSWKQWANWTFAMKQLRYHLIHGAASFVDTAFVARRTRYGVRTSQIKASFDDINRVVDQPNLSSAVDSLLDSFPDGEWLKKPPQADYLKRGKWRVTEEWHWATKWSVIYGGTWGYTTP